MMKTTSVAGLGLACAAACAGATALPFLLGGTAAGGFLALWGAEGLVLGGVALGLGGWVLWRGKRRKPQCGCAPEAGCDASEPGKRGDMPRQDAA